MNSLVRLFVFLGTASAAIAQFAPSLNPSNISIETTGSIAYLKFTYSYMCPQRLGKTVPSIQGTNVQQRVFLFEDFSVQCIPVFPPPVLNDEATIVIGQFAPGDYIYRWETSAPNVPDDPFGSAQTPIPFTIRSEPTLEPLTASRPGITFRVAGTSNLSYRVLSSSTLTNWTLLRTASSAPFTVTNQAGDLRFYKVEVRDEIPTLPGF